LLFLQNESGLPSLTGIVGRHGQNERKRERERGRGRECWYWPSPWACVLTVYWKLL